MSEKYNMFGQTKDDLIKAKSSDVTTLEKQVKSMRCCGNCCSLIYYTGDTFCKAHQENVLFDGVCDEWELNESLALVDERR